jgi:hypothetical protein
MQHCSYLGCPLVLKSLLVPAALIGGRIYIKLLFFASSWSNAMYILSSAHDASENALDTAVKGVLCDCRYIS